MDNRIRRPRWNAADRLLCIGPGLMDHVFHVEARIPRPISGSVNGHVLSKCQRITSFASSISACVNAAGWATIPTSSGLERSLRQWVQALPSSTLTRFSIRLKGIRGSCSVQRAQHRCSRNEVEHKNCSSRSREARISVSVADFSSTRGVCGAQAIVSNEIVDDFRDRVIKWPSRRWLEISPGPPS
jgi:hypothetical protein